MLHVHSPPDCYFSRERIAAAPQDKCTSSWDIATLNILINSQISLEHQNFLVCRFNLAAYNHSASSKEAAFVS
uniref:Uncharacterized protein n=1 Tax=Arundo donax TaxID=35708 RepID=A0A0A9DK84_ARUDO